MSMRKERESAFNNVTATSFSKAIVFRCMRWRCEMRDTKKSEKVSGFGSKKKEIAP